MKKNYSTLIIKISAVFLTLLEFGLLLILPKVIPDVQYSKSINYGPPFLFTGPITPERKIVQTFYTHLNQLTSLDIYFATYARSNPSTLTIVLKNQNEKIISKETLKADDLLNNTYYRFDFPPIENSANKEYTLILSSADATDSTGVASRFGYIEIANTNLSISGSEANGTLFMVPNHDLHWIDRLNLYADQIHSQKGEIASPKIFYPVLVGLSFVVNILLISIVKELFLFLKPVLRQVKKPQKKVDNEKK